MVNSWRCSVATVEWSSVWLPAGVPAGGVRQVEHGVMHGVRDGDRIEQIQLIPVRCD
jgi:hypothetical protein